MKVIKSLLKMKKISAFLLMGFLVFVIVIMFPDITIKENVEINEKERPLIFSNKMVVNSSGDIYITNDLFGSVQVYNSNGKFKYNISIRTTSMLNIYMDDFDNVHIAPGRSDMIYVVDSNGELVEMYSDKEDDRVNQLPYSEGKRFLKDNKTWYLKKYIGFSVISIYDEEQISKSIQISKLWHALFHLLFRYYFILVFFECNKDTLSAKQRKENPLEFKESLGLGQHRVAFSKYYKKVWRFRLNMRNETRMVIDDYFERNYSKNELQQSIYSLLIIAYIGIKLWKALSLFIGIDVNVFVVYLITIFICSALYYVLDLTFVYIRYEFSIFNSIGDFSSEECFKCKNGKVNLWDWLLSKIYRKKKIVCNCCGKEY